MPSSRRSFLASIAAAVGVTALASVPVAGRTRITSGASSGTAVVPVGSLSITIDTGAIVPSGVSVLAVLYGAPNRKVLQAGRLVSIDPSRVIVVSFDGTVTAPDATVAWAVLT